MNIESGSKAIQGATSDPTLNSIRLGILTPSSNTVLEPLTVAMLSNLPNVSAHFARFRVERIALSSDALAQFDPEPILTAAGHLADARVHAIVWSGTSGGWLGFGQDEVLVEQIVARFDTPASTAVLALNDVLQRTGVTSLGLVTPYVDDVQAAIIEQYSASGIEVVAERHLGDEGNFSFATFSEDTIATMIRQVAVAKPQAITVFCTNLRGAAIVAELEAELGIPIYDTVATAVWSGLQLANVEPSRLRGWGRLFES